MNRVIPTTIMGLGGLVAAGTIAATAMGDPPGVSHGYVDRAVCVDASSGRPVYLDGGEMVGAALTASDFGLSGKIDDAAIGETEDTEDSRNRYFFDGTLSSGRYQLTVSEAGAADTQGLDSDQVYPVRVTVAVGDQTRYLDIGVWLDTAEQSPNDDGLCP